MASQNPTFVSISKLSLRVQKKGNMPVSFLPLAQRERHGRFPEMLITIEVARYFYLHHDDLEWIGRKRRNFTRLGYALQLTTVRFLGTFFEDPTGVPLTVVRALACFHLLRAGSITNGIASEGRIRRTELALQRPPRRLVERRRMEYGTTNGVSFPRTPNT